MVESGSEVKLIGDAISSSFTLRCCGTFLVAIWGRLGCFVEVDLVTPWSEVLSPHEEPLLNFF